MMSGTMITYSHDSRKSVFNVINTNNLLLYLCKYIFRIYLGIPQSSFGVITIVINRGSVFAKMSINCKCIGKRILTDF